MHSEAANALQPTDAATSVFNRLADLVRPFPSSGPPVPASEAEGDRYASSRA